METFDILLAIGSTSLLLMLLTWAVWTAPWIREQGYRSAPWWSFFMGTFIYGDIITATQIARRNGSWPWPLLAQLFFLATLLGRVVAAILFLG